MIAARASLIVLSLALAAMFAPLASAREAEELPEAMEAPEPKPSRKEAEEAQADGETAFPAEEAACRKRLRELGVVFTEHEPIEEPSGCIATHPLTVSRLPGDVELRPEAVLTCAMAEATASFVRDHAAPLTRREFGSRLAAIDQVSSYVCRPRSGTRKLSEHAYANALDWGALELADETRIEVRAHRRSEPRRARLVAAIREAACGPFRTVLGPGSDADHADHFHFDLAERRGGSAFCQ